MDDNKRVVITGIGPVASIGIGKDIFWDNILKAKTNINTREYLVDNELWDKFKVYSIDKFDIGAFGIDKDSLDWITDWQEGDANKDLFYLIAAIKLALDDSNLDYNDEEDNGIGMILSHENYNLTSFLAKVSDNAYNLLKDKEKNLTKKEFHDKLYKGCVKSGYDVQPFMPLFHLAKVFNIHRHSLFTCNACASGLYALESAACVIKNNQSNIMVVTAGDYPDIYKYLWFRDLGIYSKEGIVKPFCKDSSGLVFGDGAVALILEDFNHAVARGAHIYAEYSGGGFSLESWQVIVPQVGSNAYQNAIAQALVQSKVNKNEVDVLCPHGVGSHVIDYYEAKAITDVFGKFPDDLLISTFKPYVGHNLGGSALLETAILLLSMDKGIIAPTLNREKENPKYGISLVKKKQKADIKTAIKICCAFAGFNAAAVFKRVE